MKSIRVNEKIQVAFPRLNKNDSILENEKSIKDNGAFGMNGVITKMVLMTEDEYGKFAHSLLEYRDIYDRENFTMVICKDSGEAVTVFTSGHSYARYCSAQIKYDDVERLKVWYNSL